MGSLVSARHGALSELTQPSSTHHTPPSPEGLHSGGSSSVLHKLRTSPFGTAGVKPGQFTKQRDWEGVVSTRRAVMGGWQFQAPVLFLLVNHIPFTVVKDSDEN